MKTQLFAPAEDAKHDFVNRLVIINENNLGAVFENLTKAQLVESLSKGKIAVTVPEHEITLDRVQNELAADEEFSFGVLFNTEYNTIEALKYAVNQKVCEIIADKLDDLANSYEFEL